MDNRCEICNGKGWILTAVYSKVDVEDSKENIEKCDECNLFLSDNQARKFVEINFQIFEISKINFFGGIVKFSLN